MVLLADYCYSGLVSWLRRRRVDVPHRPITVEGAAIELANGEVVFDLQGRRRNKFRPSWAAACKAAGISGLHFHDLRASAATWAATAGATVRALMNRAHSTHRVALRYQHATLECGRETADRLGSLLRPEEREETVAEVVSMEYDCGFTVARMLHGPTGKTNARLEGRAFHLVRRGVGGALSPISTPPMWQVEWAA